MSTILTFSPDLVHDLLVAAASAAAGAVAVYWRTQQQRAANTEDKRLITAFMSGNDEWLVEHQQRHALPAEAHVDAEVLHVEHATGEHPVVVEQSEHTPACPDLFYCPTVGEVESGCHGGFDVCCTAPDLHQPVDADGLARLADEVGLVQALPDRPVADEDEVGDEQPGESWPWWTPLALTVAVVVVAVLLPFWVLWLAGEWAVGKAQQAAAAWRRRRDERYMVGSGEQAVEPGEAMAAVLAASGYDPEPEPEPEPVTIVRVNHRYRKPGDTGLFPLVKVVGDKRAGRHRAEPEMPAINVPAQRTGDEA